MSSPSMDLPSQAVGAGEPASAAIGPNTAGLVRTSAGALGTQLDALTFATGAGVWVVGDARVRVHGAPTVSATSTGTRTLPSPGSAPVMVVGGSALVRSS